MENKETIHLLQKMIDTLEQYPKDTEVRIEIDDNSGGSYIEKLSEFHIEYGVNKKVLYITNL